jgi:hypothetical protein
MKIKVEFDYFGNFHRAATWLGGKHIVALSNSWEAAEEKLRAKLVYDVGELTPPFQPLPPENKEIEI